MSLSVPNTGATAVELQRWWRERKVTLPPRALDLDSARLYGVRHQPVWSWLSGFRLARFFTSVH